MKLSKVDASNDLTNGNANVNDNDNGHNYDDSNESAFDNAAGDQVLQPAGLPPDHAVPELPQIKLG